MSAQKTERKTQAKTAIIEVPQGENTGYDGRIHLDMHLNSQQATVLRRTLAVLRQQDVIVTSGHERRKIAETPSDAIRWILDEIARNA